MLTGAINGLRLRPLPLLDTTSAENVRHWPMTMSGTPHRESADAATAALLNELTVAKLLVYDADLQEALDGVFDAWDGVCAAINRLEAERLNRKSARDDAVKFLNDSLKEFDSQSDSLHTITLKRLRPTVVKAS
jgi:hypothetical protein